MAVFRDKQTALSAGQRVVRPPVEGPDLCCPKAPVIGFNNRSRGPQVFYCKLYGLCRGREPPIGDRSRLPQPLGCRENICRLIEAKTFHGLGMGVGNPFCIPLQLGDEGSTLTSGKVLATRPVAPCFQLVKQSENDRKNNHKGKACQAQLAIKDPVIYLRSREAQLSKHERTSFF